MVDVEDYGVIEEISKKERIVFTPKTKEQKELYDRSNDVNLESFYYNVVYVIVLFVSFMLLVVCYVLCYCLLGSMYYVNKVFVVLLFGWLVYVVYGFCKTKYLIDLNKMLREQVMSEVVHEVKSGDGPIGVF